MPLLSLEFQLLCLDSDSFHKAVNIGFFVEYNVIDMQLDLILKCLLSTLRCLTGKQDRNMEYYLYTYKYKEKLIRFGIV